MSYIGSTPTTQSFIAGTDYFNGDGSTTAFTLSRSVVSVNDVEVVINNVEQQPSSAYTVNGTTITFTSAPSAGTANIYVRYLSTTTQSITPSQNTVSYSTWNSDLQNKTWGFKNRLINGNMAIDQRNNGASVTCDNNQAYAVDRFYAEDNSDGVFTVQQVADAPAGFLNSLKATITTADSSLAGTQFAAICQQIEGYNFADMNFGSANAKTFTLSFWVKSSLTGTFGGTFRNSSDARCYPFTYTISSANTWEQKTITVVGDTTGTWVTNNGIGIKVWFSLGAGSTYSGTAGSWQSSLLVSATGAVSVIGTLSATFQITGVQLEIGTQATNFDVRSYGTELALCQRYFYLAAKGQSNQQELCSGGWLSSTQVEGVLMFPVTMRTAPSAQVTTVAGGYIAEYAPSTAQTFSTYGIYGTTPQACLIYNTGVSGGPIGYYARLAVVANALTSFFGFSAEL